MQNIPVYVCVCVLAPPTLKKMFLVTRPTLFLGTKHLFSDLDFLSKQEMTYPKHLSTVKHMHPPPHKKQKSDLTTLFF